MSTTSPPLLAPPRVANRLRTGVFCGLALAWYALSTFVVAGLPDVAVVLVLGLLVMLSVRPDLGVGSRGVTASGRNLLLAVLTAIAFAPLALGMNLLLGTVTIEVGHAVLATCAAVCVLLPRLAQTREFARPALLGHRELIIVVTALVAAVRMYSKAELFVAALFFPVLAAAVMAVRRIRLGAASPRRLARAWALQAGNFWLFIALLGAAGLTGMSSLWASTCRMVGMFSWVRSGRGSRRWPSWSRSLAGACPSRRTSWSRSARSSWSFSS
jgi:hypothetical protein